MSKEEAEDKEKLNIPHLKYGSIIALELGDIKNMFISSDGHINPRVMLHNFDPKTQKTEKKSKVHDLLKAPDFSTCLFQIYPKVSDTLKMQIPQKIKNAQEELQKAMEEAKKNQYNPKAVGQPKNAMKKEGNKAAIMGIEQVRKYQISLLNEYKQNFDAFDKFKNQNVVYDKEIMLLHLDSAKFLACHDHESKYEKENFQVTLDEYTSDATRFKIVPAYKYQSDGDMLIYNNESVEIIRAQAFHSKHPYLHASDEQTDEKKEKMAQIMQKFKADTVTSNQQGSKKKKREINASLEQPTSWKVQLFQHYEPPDTKQLLTGDVIWLHHSEANSMLAAVRKDKGTDKYNFSSLNLDFWLRKKNLEISVQETSSDSSTEFYSGNTFGMWLILGSKFNEGGCIAFKKQYKLKHLPSGCYLAVSRKILDKKQKRNGVDELELVLTDDCEHESNLFQFFPLKTSSSIHDTEIKNGSFIFLQNVFFKKWVDITSIMGNQFTSQKNAPKKAILKQDVSENQVFKLYRSQSQEVWETVFVTSCFNLLVKFCVQLMEKPTALDSKDDTNQKFMKYKVQRAIDCVKELDQFVNNKYGNNNIEMVYGQVNVHKQTLLREQYFIDILIKILEEILKKPELEVYQKREEIMKKEDKKRKELKQQQIMIEENEMMGMGGGDRRVSSLQQQQQQFQSKGNDIKEYITYLESKVEMAKEIYLLLQSICKQNINNELYAFDLIPFFQIHCKYIPEAITCLINICKNNQKILMKLANDLHVDYDHKKNKKEQQQQTKVVKFLINLYDEDMGKDEEDPIIFRQHDKITSKPVNLIQYFMNLIWDNSAQLHSDYLQFLSITCRINNKAVTLNQENIYKLFKKYSSVKHRIKFDEYFTSGDLKMPPPELSQEEVDQYQIDVGNQLLFASDISYGRNFLWKKELTPHFGRHYLLKNIWNENRLKNFAELRSTFIKLAISLYIDHDPLEIQQVPNFCRLYTQTDQTQAVSVFTGASNKDDEVEMFKDLIEQMMKYFYKLNFDIKNEVEEYYDKVSLGEQIPKAEKSKDFLNQKLLLNSVEILQLLLGMKLFEQKDIDGRNYYPFLIDILLRMFQYDNRNILYVMTCAKSDQKVIDELIEEKNKPLGQDLLGVTNLIGGKKKEIEPDTDMGNMNDIVDESYLYQYNLMRGHVILSNQLEGVIYDDPKNFEIELEIKLKICQIFDSFLDFRQDFLISNFMYWFKHNLIEAKDQKEFEQIIKEDIKTLLPNITKTGFKEIDEQYEPKEEVSKGFKIDINIGQNKKPPGFYNYLQQQGGFEDFDFDTYLTMSQETLYKKDKKKEGEQEEYEEIQFQVKQSSNKKNIASPLPTLLSSFLLIKNKKLETKCLELMMRIFNQRKEFVENLNKVQILFDTEKSELYSFLLEQKQRLQKYIEQNEVWFSTYIKGKTEEEEKENSIHQVTAILKTMTKAFFKNLQYYSREIIENNEKILVREIEIEEGPLILDPSKQIINKYLLIYEPILELIRDGIHHFDNSILEEGLDIQKKKTMIELFQYAFEYLKLFVQGNEENQLMMFNYMDIIESYLKYDLGQIELITEIFRNNQRLLKNNINQEFINIFLNLIENEGRQDHILDLFIVIQRFKTKYIFDNQLLVLNSFLPMKKLTEKHSKLLYIDGSNEFDYKFYLEDVQSLDKMNLLDKLREVEFRDTYCDQPFRYHKKLIEMLLETSYMVEYSEIERNEILNGEENEQQNISVAKLKKTFKLNYLLDLLYLDDNFISIPDNVLSKTKSRLENQATMYASPTKQVSAQQVQKPQDLSQDDMIQIDEGLIKSGFNMIKPILVDFIRCVYLVSEKPSANSDLLHYSSDLSKWIDIEALKLLKCNKEQISLDYLPYLFDKLIPFLLQYYKSFVQNTNQIHMLDDEERRDGESIQKFAENLKDKVKQNYFEFHDQNNRPIVTRDQVIRTQKFFATILQKEDNYLQNDSIHTENLQVYFGYEDPSPKKNKSQYSEENSTTIAGSSKMKGKLLQSAQKVQSLNKQESQKIIKESSGSTKQYQSITSPGQPPKQSGWRKNKKEIPPVRVIQQDNMGQIEGIWNDLIKKINESELVQEEIEIEQNALADAIISVKQIVHQEYIGNHIEPRPELNILLKKFIQWMQYSVQDIENKDAIDTLLTNFKKILDSDDDEKKENLQNMFDNLGGMRMVLSILSDQNSNLDSDLLISLLEFANMLLDGGNNKIQRTIFEYVSTSPTSEHLFQKFNSIIRRQINYIEEKAKAKKSKKGAILEDHKDELAHEQDIRILNNVLNFLQNCVEGHYLDLQNYFREQTNSRNNYNMINAVADLLRTYYYDAKVQKMYDNMIQCLDTLSEFVQGPCPENQTAVSESKFFEICSDFFNKKPKEDTNKKNIQKQKSTEENPKKKSLKDKVKVVSAVNQIQAALSMNEDEKKVLKGDLPLETWMIARLQNKCLVLVLSLLEMRDVKTDTSIIERIVRNFHPTDIERNMRKVYKKFHKIYKDTYPIASLGHLDEDPRKLDQKQKNKLPQHYFETILQNGFYMYFLLCYYIEADDGTMQGTQSSLLFKQHQKKKIQPEVQGLEKLLLGDTIIGQLIQFFIQIFKIFYESSKQLQQIAADNLAKTGYEETEEEKQKKAREKAEKQKKMLKKSFQFFANNSAQIEVIRNDTLELVFFILLPYAHALPKEKKQAFHEIVDRSNNKSKVQDLIDASESLIQVCKHELWLKTSKNKLLTFFGHYVKLWKDLAFLMTLVLNIFIFFSYSTTYGHRMEDVHLFQLEDYTAKQTKALFQLLGILMTVFSNFVLIFFLIKNVPLIIKNAWKDNDSNKKKKKEKSCIQKTISIIIKCGKVVIAFLKSSDVMYYIAYGTLAVMGVVYHPFYFTFHLTEIMLRYPSLKNVLKSVYEPRRQLILTFVLFIVIEYFFVIIAYIYLHDDYGGNCESVLYCFLVTIDQTFKSNSGVGAFLTDVKGQTNVAQDNFGRFLFDNLFFYILVLIMVEIVSGIIIDTFGQLREEENEKREDIWDKCFICGNLRTTFDRQSDTGAGFLHHIKINHYMWNYMFFIAYLEWKDSNDYTGIESFVTEKLAENDSQWFPFNKARELQDQDEQSEEKKDIKKMEELTSQLSEISENLKDIDSLIQKANNRKR